MFMLLKLALRAIGTYFTLLFMTRLMGKRQLSQLTYRDYIVGITIGGIATRGVVDLNNSFFLFIPGLIIFSTLQIVFSYITLKSESFRKMSNGVSVPLIYNGRIIKDNLKKVRINVDELAANLRQKNIFNFSDVRYAFIEPNGKISVLLDPNKQPLTPYHIGLLVNDNGLPLPLVKDGVLIKETLQKYDLTEAWIKSELNKQNINSISDIMLAQIDKSGIIYVDLFKDSKVD